MKTRQRHVREARAFLPEAIGRLEWNRDQILEAQTLGLRKVVAQAQKQSPFYASRLGALEASTLELSDLPKIPVLTKDLVMTHWDELVTDRRLSLEAVSEHLERIHHGREENPYLYGDIYAAATGGSTGKRGVFLWDWESFIVSAAICFRMEARQDAQTPKKGPGRSAVVCAGSFGHASRFLFPTPLDPNREMRVFPASLPLSDLVKELNLYQPDRLIGYASIVQELCALALDGDLQVSLNRISSNSEPLFPEARAMAKDAWGINIHNSWGSVELGLAASEGESFGGASLAEDFLIFEPVDEDGQPCAGSDAADRILGTKLFGSIMPMIRYEMTDSLSLDAGENPDAPGCRRITEIKGRSDAWFVYGDTLKIHPMNFRSVLGQDRHISEYQVRQTENGARVLAVTHGDDSLDPTRKALCQVLSEAGLPDPVVSLEKVAELPRHPQTGKFTRFVPLKAN